MFSSYEFSGLEQMSEKTKKPSVNKQILAKNQKPKGKPFLQTTRLQCKYILNNYKSVQNALACGEPVVGIHSWCADHFKLVYRNPQPTKRG